MGTLGELLRRFGMSATNGQAGCPRGLRPATLVVAFAADVHDSRVDPSGSPEFVCAMHALSRAPRLRSGMGC